MLSRSCWTALVLTAAIGAVLDSSAFAQRGGAGGRGGGGFGGGGGRGGFGGAAFGGAGGQGGFGGAAFGGAGGQGGFGGGQGMMPPPRPGMMQQGAGGGQCQNGGSSTSQTSGAAFGSIPQMGAFASQNSLSGNSPQLDPESQQQLELFQRVGPGFARFRVNSVFRNLDDDNDGTLAASEIPARLRERLLKADTDNDLSVSREELEEAREASLRFRSVSRRRSRR